MPVMLATTACSKLTLVPSAKLVTIAGFWPHFSAKAACVVGVRYGSCRPLMLPQRTGRTPRPFTKRQRLPSTPGWSPSTSVKTTPALSALAFKSGPRVPSSSGFIKATCLPCSIAARTGPTASSTAPVTSSSTSTCGLVATSIGSSVTAARPDSIAFASAAGLSQTTASSWPASA